MNFEKDITLEMFNLQNLRAPTLEAVSAML